MLLHTGRVYLSPPENGDTEYFGRTDSNRHAIMFMKVWPGGSWVWGQVGAVKKNTHFHPVRNKYIENGMKINLGCPGEYYTHYLQRKNLFILTSDNAIFYKPHQYRYNFLIFLFFFSKITGDTAI